MKKIIISLFLLCTFSLRLKSNKILLNFSRESQEDYYSEPKNLENKLKDAKSFKVINIYKRKNPTVYTQGLYYNNRTLYESGGSYKESTLTQMDWPSQNILKQIKLESKYFGEGISGCNKNGILYQLTYRERDILLYSFPDLRFIGSIKMPEEMEEGWGMNIGVKDYEFLATDGSDKIYTLKINKANNELYVKSSITVTYNNQSISFLNELTYDGNYIYSNIYQNNNIIKIDPNNGSVIKSYDMNPLIDYEKENGDLTDFRIMVGDVLNGIVYIPERKTYLVTGKLWNYYYEVVFE